MSDGAAGVAVTVTERRRCELRIVLWCPVAVRGRCGRGDEVAGATEARATGPT